MVCRVVCVRGFPPVALPLVAFLHWLPAFRSLARHVRRARDVPHLPRSGSGVTAAPDSAAPRNRAPGGVTWSRIPTTSWTSGDQPFHCAFFFCGAVHVSVGNERYRAAPEPRPRPRCCSAVRARTAPGSLMGSLLGPACAIGRRSNARAAREPFLAARATEFAAAQLSPHAAPATEPGQRVLGASGPPGYLQAVRKAS